MLGGVLWVAAAGASAPEGAHVGVRPDPCAGVPTQPAPRHQLAKDPFRAWMDEWLALDWGQLCRYRGDNARLPASTPRRVVFFGDSITEGWATGSPALFAGDRINRGISGQTSAQMLVRFRADVLALRPAVLHLLAGTNDVAGNTGSTSIEDIAGNIETMVELARRDRIEVVIGSILPTRRYPWRPQIEPVAPIRAINRWLAEFAATQRLAFINYFAAMSDPDGGMRRELSDDGVHPNAAGYAVMSSLAAPTIDAALASGARRR